MTIPIVTIINTGPELLQKVIIRSASDFVHLLFEYKSLTIFAPIGYPPNEPNKNAVIEHPGTLNSTRVIGSNNFSIQFAIPNFKQTFEHTK